MGGDSDNQQKMIEGVAATFNDPYDMGWFTEEIAAGALDGADMSEVVALFNHDANIPLGRNSAGTLQLSIDAQGFRYSFMPPDSPNGHNVAESIRRGDVKQSSWGFTVKEDAWRTVDGKDFRTIVKIAKVWDVSPVTYPANPNTEVAQRSKKDFQIEIPLPENATSTININLIDKRLRLVEANTNAIKIQ